MPSSDTLSALDVRKDPQHQCSFVAELLQVLSEAGVAVLQPLSLEELERFSCIAGVRRSARPWLQQAEELGLELVAVEELFPPEVDRESCLDAHDELRRILSDAGLLRLG